MATWVRSNTGTLPSATNADLTGTVELGNGTAPGDFLGTAVTSVQIQWTIEVTTGALTNAETHSVLSGADLTLNGNGTDIANVTGASGTLDSGTTSVSQDATDSTIGTGFSTAQWEGAEVNPNTTWTTFNQDMGPDGATVAITSVTVTITYAGTTTVSPTTLAATSTISQPTIAYGAGISPTALVATSTIVQPSLTAGTGASISNTVLIGTSTINQPTVVPYVFLRPNANISVTGWSPNGAATVWEAVELDDVSYAEYT